MRPVEFSEFTLPNGLHCIVHENHTTPIVAVDLWYHVGSKNERPDRTGFAHLFEHLMFQAHAMLARPSILLTSNVLAAHLTVPPTKTVRITLRFCPLINSSLHCG